MDIFLSVDNGETKRTLRKYIRQAKNKESVIAVIKTYLNKNLSDERMEELILLAVKVDGVLFLNQALLFYRNNGSDYLKLRRAYILN